MTVAVYTEPRGEMMCMYQGQQGGVTHIQFSHDGNMLFSGGRKVFKLCQIFFVFVWFSGRHAVLDADAAYDWWNGDHMLIF
jgi:hypothetical protein